jgi:hypothetical protein
MTTLPAPTFTASDSTQSDDWVGELDVNAYGVRLLTLPRALELASAGCCAGWYVSPFALQWTVGRMTANGRRFHVIAEGEPIRFGSVAEAVQFLGGTLKLPAAPQLAFDCSRVSFGSAAS